MSKNRNFSNKGKGHNNQNQGGGHYSTPPEVLPSPYNFAPLPARVLFPEDNFASQDATWKSPPSQDLPYKDGVSGYLDITLTTQTTTFIRSSKGKDSPDFFQIEKSGQYAIPGTSLKGAIRSVIEPITFSRLAPLHETVLAYRDLSSSKNEYLSFFNKNEPESGWLQEEEDGSWSITPCSWCKLEHDYVSNHLNGPDLSPVKKALSAEKKYEVWDNHFKHNRQVHFTPTSGSLIPTLHRNPTSNSINGTVVFVGNINAPKHPGDKKKEGMRNYKHRDYIFYDEKAASKIKLEDLDRRRFEQAHRINDDLTPNWKLHRKALKKGKKIPVFFHRLGHNKVASFGLARLYRLPYDYSTTGLLQERREGEDPSSMSKLDFAETLFGRVTEDNNAIKGRIQFETLLANGNPKLADKVNHAVLGQPRPTYFPAYVEQQGENGKAINYNTWNNRSGKANLRGWKRYPSRNQAYWPTKPPEGKVNTKVATSFIPLETGSSFTGRVYVHNLRPTEIGALIWVLTWGGNAKLHHKIGMAKPFGHGSVTISINGELKDTLRANHPDEFPIQTADDYIKAFEELMEGATKDWEQDMWDKEKSSTLTQLIHMADPANENPLNETRYPDPVKQFQQIKTRNLFLIRPNGETPSAPPNISKGKGPKFQGGRPVPPPKIITPVGKEMLKGMTLDAVFLEKKLNKKKKETFVLEATSPDGSKFKGNLTGDAKSNLPDGFGDGWCGKVKVHAQPQPDNTGAQFSWPD